MITTLAIILITNIMATMMMINVIKINVDQDDVTRFRIKGAELIVMTIICLDDEEQEKDREL